MKTRTIQEMLETKQLPTMGATDEGMLLASSLCTGGAWIKIKLDVVDHFRWHITHLLGSIE